MEDIAALLRSSTESSLVFVDEIGRGTSPTDGTSLAGVVLEEMATAKMNGIFATHLHDILTLPLREEAKHNIATKRMQSDYKPTEEIKKIRWTYKLMDGLCTDSHAIVTAVRFGIPDGILCWDYCGLGRWFSMIQRLFLFNSTSQVFFNKQSNNDDNYLTFLLKSIAQCP